MRSLAWRVSLWQKSILACYVLPEDLLLLAQFRTAEEWWDHVDPEIEILFLLFVAEAIEQGDF